MSARQHAGPGADDRIAIDDLYNEYLWALDTGDTDAVVACFAEHAELRETQRDESVWVGNGLDDVREFVLKYHTAPSFPGHQHRETQRVFRPDPDGRADHWWAQSYILATVFDVETHTATAYWAGYYRDIVAKIDGEWVFVFRWIAPWKGDVLSRFGARA
jgi:hypothetical protein